MFFFIFQFTLNASLFKAVSEAFARLMQKLLLPECVFVLTETRALTVHAIYAVWAHPVPAVRTAEARLAQTGSIDVVAARTVSTVAHAFTVLSVTTCSTLLLTP